MTFLHSLILGFSIAAPVGPIGVLCIERTRRAGRVAGLTTGLGAATADAVYGAVAAGGLTALTAALTGAGMWLRPVGGAYLVWMGVRTLRAPAAGLPAAADGFAATFLLTLTNPMTILSFAALFGTLGALASPLPVVTGVFAGSMLWWVALTTAVSLLPVPLRALNAAAGVVLTLLGLRSLLS
jgi:threonine/homoserine/homoserine lactone efflux protein